MLSSYSYKDFWVELNKKISSYHNIHIGINKQINRQNVMETYCAWRTYMFWFALRAIYLHEQQTQLQLHQPTPDGANEQSWGLTTNSFCSLQPILYRLHPDYLSATFHSQPLNICVPCRVPSYGFHWNSILLASSQDRMSWKIRLPFHSSQTHRCKQYRDE